MKRTQRILHATDLSTASRRAFAKAVELAIQEHAELLLLHVIALPASFVASEPPADYLAFLSQARRETARRLAAVLARAKKSGIRVEAKLVEGERGPQLGRARPTERGERPKARTIWRRFQAISGGSQVAFCFRSMPREDVSDVLKTLIRIIDEGVISKPGRWGAEA